MMNHIKYPFSNSVVFSMVMEDPELCRELIERIFPDRKVDMVRIREKPQAITEATLIAGLQAKPIRLDVRFEDGNNWYDIELQVALENELPKRSRYYASVGDVKMLQKGQEYRDLKPSFVIFICCFDFFGMDKPVYEFQRYDPKLNLPLGDESFIIILNSKCSKEKVPENLRSLFRYINESEVTPGDRFVETVHERVEALQESEEVKNVMTLDEEIRIRWNRMMKENEEKVKEAVKAAVKEAEEKSKEAVKEAEEKAKAAEAESEARAAEAQERLNTLNAKLLDDDRIEDLKNAVRDPDLRARLFEEYGL